MPIGKVRWYDKEKGFGFVSNPGDKDAYVPKQVLPRGVDELHPGQKIEFDFAAGRKGPQVLRMTLVEEPRVNRSVLHKHDAEKLHGMVSDMMILLDAKVLPDLRNGHRPDAKTGHQVAEILRAVATELDA